MWSIRGKRHNKDKGDVHGERAIGYGKMRIEGGGVENGTGIRGKGKRVKGGKKSCSEPNGVMDRDLGCRGEVDASWGGDTAYG